MRRIILFTLLAGCQGGITIDSTDTDFPVDPSESDTDVDTDADSDTDTDSDSDADPNTPPVADAGDDQSGGLTGSVVGLDGSGSSDPDGDELSYNWTMLDSPAGWGGSIINATRVEPQFFADTPGTYEIELEVDDGEYRSTDSVIVEIEQPNEVPVAAAGADQFVTEGDNVTLNGGSSYDPDNDPLTYSWVMTDQPAGSSASLTGADTPAPTFTADAIGVFSIELTVSDGTNVSAPDIVRVTAESVDGGGGSGSCSSGCARANQYGYAAAMPLPGLLPLMFMVLYRRKS